MPKKQHLGDVGRLFFLLPWSSGSSPTCDLPYTAPPPAWPRPPGPNELNEATECFRGEGTREGTKDSTKPNNEEKKEANTSDLVLALEYD